MRKLQLKLDSYHTEDVREALRELYGRRPVVGVLSTRIRNTTRPDIKFATFGVEAEYKAYLTALGCEVVVIMPDTSPSSVNIDMLLLPGGADISVALHRSEAVDAYQGADNPAFTEFYTKHFNKWREAEIPMFGICAGFQGLNLALGGGITEHGLNHSLGTSTHYLVTRKGEVIETNSRHHQFVRLHQLAEGLEPTVLCGYREDDEKSTSSLAVFVKGRTVETLAQSSRISHVEAFRGRNCAGVQWHPESGFVDRFTRGEWFANKEIFVLLVNALGLDVEEAKEEAFCYLTQ